MLNLPEPKEFPVVPKPVLPRLLPKPPAPKEPLLPTPPREPLLPKPPTELLPREPVLKLLKPPLEKVWLARGWVIKPELVNPELLVVKRLVRLLPTRLLLVPETFKRFEFTTVSPVVLLKFVLPDSGSLNVLMLFALNCVELVVNGFAVLLEKLLNPVEEAEENDVTTITLMGCLHRQPANFCSKTFVLGVAKSLSRNWIYAIDRPLLLRSAFRCKSP